MGQVDSIASDGKSNSTDLPIPRVMVVSSVLLYREGIAASIDTDGRMEVLAITDQPHAIAEAQARRPDAILFDATSEEALATARKLKRQNPSIILVGFGISNTAEAAVSCAEAGASGFIDENGSIDALVRTTLSALDGEFCCSPRVTAILCERLAAIASGNAYSAPVTSLTPRELEIASLISDGLSNKEIARDLRIGPATVKNHVHNILDKLGVRRRAAIASRVPQY